MSRAPYGRLSVHAVAAKTGAFFLVSQARLSRRTWKSSWTARLRSSEVHQVTCTASISLASTSFPGFRSEICLVSCPDPIQLGLGTRLERYIRGTRLWESSYGVDFNYRAVRWGSSVSSPVCVVAGCHSLPLPTAQEICPHPLTEDAEVGRGKVLSRDCGIAIDPRAYAAHCCHLYLWLPSTSLQEDNKGLKGWSLVCLL